MKDNNKPKYSMWQSICFMLQHAWQYRRCVIFHCILLVLLNVGLNLIQLYISPTVLGILEEGRSLAQLLTVIGLFVLGLVLMRGFKTYIDANVLYSRVDIRKSIVNDIIEKVGTTSYPNTIEPEFIKKLEKAKNSTSGNDRATEYIWTTMTSLLTHVLSFLCYLGLLSGLSWFLILLTLVITIIGFFVSNRINMWGYRHSDKEEGLHRDTNYLRSKMTSVTLAKDIRILGLQDWLKSVWQKCLSLLDAYAVKREKVYIWINILDVALSFLRNGIAYAYLIGMALSKNLSASEFLLYFTAFTGFTNWVTGIMQEFSSLHLQCLDLSIVQEFLNYPEPFLFDKGEKPKESDSYELRMEHVSFRYPGTEKYIFRDLNLVIHPGERIAIVGLNGAGKTTIVKLLCGLYDPDEGQVLLNGIDIRKFDRRKYYDLFSAVFQECSLMDITLGENVSQQIDAIENDRIRDCIERAGLTSTVSQLPKGLHTPVGRDVFLDGVLFSGGQTLRLMLARAVYKDGPILILDEPTAALDPLAEHDIYMKYSAMTAGKTSIFISHRLASTRFCDRILYVDGGGVKEEGTHEQLLELGGGYASLVEIQSRYYQEGRDIDETAV